MNIIVKDKNIWDFAGAKRQLDYWLQQCYPYITGNYEAQYENIQRKVFAEEYIEGMSSDNPQYNVFCFGGQPKWICRLRGPHSVYVDGCVEINGDISCYLPQGGVGISAFRHPLHDSVFYEALNQTNNNRANVDETIAQMKRYISEKMPIHIGMSEMGVIGRDHSNETGNKLMDEWWNEYCLGAARDQFSFSYVLWRAGYRYSDLSMIGNNRYKVAEIKTLLHPHNSVG